MATDDDTGRLRVETLRTPDPGAIKALPMLFRVETELLDLHANLGALHYSLSAYLLRRGATERDDWTLTEITANALRKLDELRATVRAARHIAARGLG